MKQDKTKNQENTEQLAKQEDIFVDGLARILIEQAKWELKKQEKENTNLRKEQKML